MFRIDGHFFSSKSAFKNYWRKYYGQPDGWKDLYSKYYLGNFAKTEEEGMKFIAISANTAQNSGLKDTRKEVEDWSAKILGTNPGITSIFVCQAVATIEREQSPIKVTEIVEPHGYKPPATPQRAPNGSSCSLEAHEPGL